jgi:hypothetical protein
VPVGRAGPVALRRDDVRFNDRGCLKMDYLWPHDLLLMVILWPFAIGVLVLLLRGGRQR